MLQPSEFTPKVTGIFSAASQFSCLYIGVPDYVPRPGEAVDLGWRPFLCSTSNGDAGTSCRLFPCCISRLPEREEIQPYPFIQIVYAKGERKI